ncbi:acetate--CoA ligase family protein [Streptomyces sp. NPDC005962]|uniref:acetate--CoA ligase family protein n=1 Tax=Streptomyces sp. NPDC005962 TaxID=3154466 RepID=UPI0033F9A1DB
MPVPEGAVATAGAAAEVARDIGFPVVVKALSETIAHKSDVGAPPCDGCASGRC